MTINARQVQLDRATSSNFQTLKDFIERRKVQQFPFAEAQQVTVSGANFVLIDASMIAGNIAVLTGTSPYATALTQGGIVAGILAGAVGSGATTNFKDENGNYLNLVPVRNADTHDEILVNGFVVSALVQCSSTVTEGDAIGAAASENLQLSFVYVDSSNVLQLATLSEDIEFAVNVLTTVAKEPVISLDGGVSANIIEPTQSTVIYKRQLEVTTAFIANEVITLSTGAGATAGASTTAGDVVTLQTSAAIFNGAHATQIYLNGVRLIKGVDVIWDSTTTMHITLPMDAGDYLEIQTNYSV